MMSEPFFSVLIPTKNRSQVVAYAVQSVLDQKFTDFEIIIADNDDTDETEKAVSQYISDERVIYVRTGGLNMIDNWEAARKASKGKFITVLEDKQVFYPHTLEVVHSAISKHDCDVIGWLPDRYRRDNDGSLVRLNHVKNDVELHDPIPYMVGMIEKSFVDTARFPRMINAAISRKLIQATTDRLGKDQFFYPLSPDFTAGFLALAMSDKKYVLLNSPLVITDTTRSVSNGQKNMRSIKATYSCLSEFGFDEDKLFSYMPVKVPFVINSMLNDFYMIKEMLPEIPDPNLNMEMYLESIIRELSYKQDMGFSECASILRLVANRSYYYCYKGLLRFVFKKIQNKVFCNKESRVQVSWDSMYKESWNEKNWLYPNV